MYRKTNLAYRFFYLASILVLSFLIGCAATKPNLSIIDKNYAPPKKIEKDKNFLTTKSLLAEISLRNHLLAQELGKLPEIQDGISNSEVAALEHIVDIYNEIPKEFNDAFDKMYRVGIPEVRKYCSPLQALFWLSCENRIQDIKKILHNYSLVQLLHSAWKFEKEHTVTKKQLSSIIDGTKNQRLKEEYTDYLDSLELTKLERAIFFDYQSNPKYFNWQTRKIITEEEKLRIDPRWVNFDEVTDRLNAPEIVNYYEKRRISYQYYWDIPGYSSNPDPYYVFKHNKGNCTYITAFTVYCLKKAGYRAYVKKVPCSDPRFANHWFTVFVQDGKKYVMDNGTFPFKRGITLYSDDLY